MRNSWLGYMGGNCHVLRSAGQGASNVEYPMELQSAARNPTLCNVESEVSFAYRGTMLWMASVMD